MLGGWPRAALGGAEDRRTGVSFVSGNSMVSGVHEKSKDRSLAKLLACLEPVQAFNQNKTITVAPNQDWSLLTSLQHAFGNVVYRLRIERRSAFDGHIDVRDRE